MAAAQRGAHNSGVKICAATDLSDAGHAAVARAIAWAEQTPSELTLLHVVHDPELAPALGDDVPGDVERAREALEELAASAAPDCRVDVRAAEDVAGEILAAAAGCDYLFVGCQGKSALERLRLGSIATAVMRKSATPVVCCPSPN